MSDDISYVDRVTCVASLMTLSVAFLISAELEVIEPETTMLVVWILIAMALIQIIWGLADIETIQRLVSRVRGVTK